MKKGIIFATIIFLSFTYSFSQTVANVDAVKFNTLIQSGNGIVLDVRTPQEYSRGHIANSTLINIADRDFTNKVTMLQKDKPIYVYCLSGSRSRAAADYLSKNGFKQVYNLQHGLMEWQSNNLPLEQSATIVASNSKAYTPSDFKTLTSSNKLVFVDFNAVWCAPCKTMNPVIDQLSENYKQKVRVEKIDMEANRELAQSLDAQSIPGFVLFKNGQKIWSGEGVLSYDELKKLLDKNL
jgi:thioredoxin 1